MRPGSIADYHSYGMAFYAFFESCKYHAALMRMFPHYGALFSILTICGSQSQGGGHFLHSRVWCQGDMSQQCEKTLAMLSCGNSDLKQKLQDQFMRFQTESIGAGGFGNRELVKTYRPHILWGGIEIVFRNSRRR